MRNFYRTSPLFNTEGGEGNGNAEKIHTASELQASMHKARTEERARLQGLIDNAAAENTKLKSDLAAAQAAQKAAEADAARHLAALEAFKGSKTENGHDAAALIEKTVKAAEDRAKAAYEEIIGGLQNRVNELETTNKQTKVTLLRNRLIAASDPSSFIEEMVTGDDEASILESIEKAKAAFSRKNGASKKKTEDEGKGAEDEEEETEIPASSARHGGGTGNRGGSDGASLRMPPSEWKAKREEIMRTKGLKNRYAVLARS